MGHKHERPCKLIAIPEEEAYCIRQVNNRNNSLLLSHLRYGNFGYKNLKLILDKYGKRNACLSKGSF